MSQDGILFEYSTGTKIVAEKKSKFFLRIFEDEEYQGTVSATDLVKIAEGELEKPQLERLEGLVRNVNTDEEVREMRQIIASRKIHDTE